MSLNAFEVTILCYTGKCVMPVPNEAVIVFTQCIFTLLLLLLHQYYKLTFQPLTKTSGDETVVGGHSS